MFRHVAPDPWSGWRFLTAARGGRAALWSLENRSLTAELDTVLDIPDYRLTLCRAAGEPVVVAAAWERHGICAYALDGALRWQRKDLRQAQLVTSAAGGELAVACFDLRPMHVLSAASGETVATVRGVRAFDPSRYAPVGVGAAGGSVVLVDTDTWKIAWKVLVDRLGVMVHGTGAPGEVAARVSPSTGSPAVRAYDLAGEPLWEWGLPPETTCPSLEWDQDAGEWVGLLHQIERARPESVVRWARDGRVASERALGDPAADYDLLAGGRHAVSSDGRVLETSSGAVVWQLAA